MRRTPFRLRSIFRHLGYSFVALVAFIPMAILGYYIGEEFGTPVAVFFYVLIYTVIRVIRNRVAKSSYVNEFRKFSETMSGEREGKQ